MKTLKLAALAGAAALLLSACSMLNALVPDQPVTDALGLDGQAVTLTPVAPAALGTAAAASEFRDAGLSATFADLDVSQVPAGIQPSALEQEIGLGATLTVTFADGAAQPDALTVTGMDVDLTLADAGSSLSVVGSVTDLDASFAKDACTGSVCTYALSTSATPAMTLELADLVFDLAYEIMTTGGENTLSGAYAVTIDPAVDVVSIEATLVSSEGVLKF